jgi:hypothetical protein
MLVDGCHPSMLMVTGNLERTLGLTVRRGREPDE